MTTINAGTPALPVGAQRPSTGRALRRDLTGVGLIALLIWVTGLWVSGGGLGDLTSVAGALTSAGRITGLWASALLLVQVFLMARVPIPPLGRLLVVQPAHGAPRAHHARLCRLLERRPVGHDRRPHRQ
jgi:hypothetical protein